MAEKFKKRILFVGMPDMAIICLTKLAAENVNIVACVPPHSSSSTYNLFCDFAKNLDWEIVEWKESLKEESFLEKLRQLNIDLAVVCSYNKRLPKEMLPTLMTILRRALFPAKRLPLSKVTKRQALVRARLVPTTP